MYSVFLVMFQIVFVLASFVAVSIANPLYSYGEYNGYGYNDFAHFGYDRQISSFGYYTGPTYPYDYGYNENSYFDADSPYTEYANPYELPWLPRSIFMLRSLLIISLPGLYC